MPSPDDAPDHSALDILTRAAMQSRVSSNTMISTPQNGNLSEANSYSNSILSSRDMDALASGGSVGTGRQHSYLHQTYPELGAHLSTHHAGNDLRILNAESYNDSFVAPRDTKRRLNSKKDLPFGVAEQAALDPAMRTAVEEHDSAPKRKKRRVENQIVEDEDETKVRTRGRPRVAPNDETAADVSWLRFWLEYHYMQNCAHLHLLGLFLTLHSAGGPRYAWPREPIAIAKNPQYPP